MNLMKVNLVIWKIKFLKFMLSWLYEIILYLLDSIHRKTVKQTNRSNLIFDGILAI
jgi:hypothetical protein